MRNVYRILIGKLEAKRQFGRSRHRWEVNVKIRPKLVQDRMQWRGTTNTVNEPSD
jgi:hypothetical protein